MGCVSSNEGKSKENEKQAERIIEITWSKFDKDGNGSLSAEELKGYVKESV